MVATIESLTLADLKAQFGLVSVADRAFFPEWQGDRPTLTPEERSRLERIRLAYDNFSEHTFAEKVVELAILAPLLDMAGFFLPPFYLETEKPVELASGEDGVILRGRLDVLVLRDRLWVLAIESKRAAFSLQVGIPQVLAYMLAAEGNAHSRFGMVTNGESFVFLKLERPEADQSPPRYGKSRIFLVEQDDGLAWVLGILRRLGAIVGQDGGA